MDDAFAGRVLDFDKAAAYACGGVSADRESKGPHADAVDMMVAGIVDSANATPATRNITDFEECGIELVNPWQQER